MPRTSASPPPRAPAGSGAAARLLDSGATFTKTYGVPANRRVMIPVDTEEIPAGSGQHPLQNIAVSSDVQSTNNVPIVVERTMWWPSPEITSDYWIEAHNSPGTTETGRTWALAEGETGGTDSTETFVLIANTSPFAGQARVTFYAEDGSTAERVVSLLPTSRTTINMSADVPELQGKRYGAIIDALGDTPAAIVVERAMYSSPGGVTWAAGTNAVGTRLR